MAQTAIKAMHQAQTMEVRQGGGCQEMMQFVRQSLWSLGKLESGEKYINTTPGLLCLLCLYY